MNWVSVTNARGTHSDSHNNQCVTDSQSPSQKNERIISSIGNEIHLCGLMTQFLLHSRAAVGRNARCLVDDEQVGLRPGAQTHSGKYRVYGYVRSNASSSQATLAASLLHRLLFPRPFREAGHHPLGLGKSGLCLRVFWGWGPGGGNTQWLAVTRRRGP